MGVSVEDELRRLDHMTEESEWRETIGEPDMFGVMDENISHVLTTTLRHGGCHVHYTMSELGHSPFLDALNIARTYSANMRRIAERGPGAGVAPRSFVGFHRFGTCTI